MRYSKIFSIIFIVTVVLIGCTNDDSTEEQNDDPSTETTQSNESETDDSENNNEEENEKEEEQEDNELAFLQDISSAPENTADLINQKQGQYAGIDVRDDTVEEDVLADVRKLPPLAENANQDELDKYFNYLYSLVSEDFPDPQDTINKWEFGSFGNPDLPDSRYHFKENYNVEIILDASGSMANYVGDQTRMQLAKESINKFLENVPEEANVSLRIYGHEGSSEDSDKALSCGTIEQIYGFDTYDQASFEEALNQFEPSGWTPIADALEQSKEALDEFDSENNTNLIYLVSDGIETCDGDPVEVADSLVESNSQPIINIIGFQADAEAQEQLQSMADAAEGIYATVNNQDELEAEFERAEKVMEAWEDWKEDAMGDVDNLRVDSHFDIMALTNDWHKLRLKLTNNISRLIRIFEDEGIINKDQADEFKSKRIEIKDLIDSSRHEIDEQLQDISTDTLEDMKNTINERYEEQTEE
ncbi:VWA domain-containing protein [Virgibacillus ainsalahensis]